MDHERELALRARLRELHVQPPDHLISAMLELGDELPSDDTELFSTYWGSLRTLVPETSADRNR